MRFACIGEFPLDRHLSRAPESPAQSYLTSARRPHKGTFCDPTDQLERMEGTAQCLDSTCSQI
jgi:hypothetical protein